MVGADRPPPASQSWASTPTKATAFRPLK